MVQVDFVARSMSRGYLEAQPIALDGAWVSCQALGTRTGISVLAADDDGTPVSGEFELTRSPKVWAEITVPGTPSGLFRGVWKNSSPLAEWPENISFILGCR